MPNIGNVQSCVEHTNIEIIHVFREKPLCINIGSRNGINYVYQITKLPPKSNTVNDNKPKKHNKYYSSTMAEMRYEKLVNLLGKQIKEIQEINVLLFTIEEISNLISEIKCPIYIKFGEEISKFEQFEFSTFDASLHSSYFASMINSPPSQYSSMDCQRMTLLFFSVFALDLLFNLRSTENKNNAGLNANERQDIIDWIYAQQINDERNGCTFGGFRGGSFLGIPFANKSNTHGNIWDRVNLASTHNALCLLIVLNDDLSLVNKPAIMESLKLLQDSKTGSFHSMIDGELDMRFIYCACTICYLLDDWSGIPDVDQAMEYISDCQTYDGSIAFRPGLEGHGGSTFVAVASLVLAQKMHLIDVQALIRWCILNQGQGFRGRPQKPQDSCYSFWIAAVLSMISSYSESEVFSDLHFVHNERKEFYNMCNHRYNRLFNLECQSGFGGFCKLPRMIFPDILHGYMGLAGMAMMHESLANEMNGFTEKVRSDDAFPHLFGAKLFPPTTCTVNKSSICPTTCTDKSSICKIRNVK